MSEEQLSPEEQQELDTLAELVAESLANGETPAQVSKQLSDNGWDKDEADEFVNMIAMHLASEQHAAPQSRGGGSGMGWLLWIGALLLINLLSWLFNWPFWIY